ncbi:MAG: hypothetical protein ACPG49_12260 [Chitinophagales bacterium]
MICEDFKHLHNQTEYENIEINLESYKYYGDRITVQSLLEKGSIFTVTFPLLQ